MDKKKLITELLQLSQELAKALTHGHFELIEKLIELKGAVQTEQNKEEQELIDMAKEYDKDAGTPFDEPVEPPKPEPKGKTHKPKIEQPDDVLTEHGFESDDFALPEIQHKPAVNFDIVPESDLPF